MIAGRGDEVPLSHRGQGSTILVQPRLALIKTWLSGSRRCCCGCLAASMLRVHIT